MKRRTFTIFVAAMLLPGALAVAQSNACDLVAPFGMVDSADVQAAIDMTLGIAPCTAAIGGPGICNVAVVQRVINASLTGGLCVTGGGAIPHAVTLNWTSGGSANVSGYNLYRATQAGGPYSKVNAASITATTYVDIDITGGQRYYYVSTTVDTDGSESIYSNEAQAIVPTP